MGNTPYFICHTFSFIMIHGWKDWYSTGENQNLWRTEMSRARKETNELCRWAQRLFCLHNHSLKGDVITAGHTWSVRQEFRPTYLCVRFQSSWYLVVHSNSSRVSGYCCASFGVHLKNAVRWGAPRTMSTCRRRNIVSGSTNKWNCFNKNCLLKSTVRIQRWPQPTVLQKDLRWIRSQSLNDTE